MAANGNWLSVMIGRVAPIDSPSIIPRLKARLFTSSLNHNHGLGRLQSGDESLTLQLNGATWLDDNHFAMIWPRPDGIRQVLSIDAETGQQSWVTSSQTNVIRFARSSEGELAYSAQHLLSDAETTQSQNGLAITNPDVYSLLEGDLDGRGGGNLAMNGELYLLSKQGRGARLVTLNASSYQSVYSYIQVFSHNGKSLLVDGPADLVPPSWDSYRDEITQSYIRDRRSNNVHASGVGDLLKQIYVVDTSSGSARKLIDAPMYYGMMLARSTLVWAPDDRSVLVGPSFLPPEMADTKGISGKAYFEVDVSSGAVRTLAIPSAIDVSSIERAIWISSSEIGIHVKSQLYRFQRQGESWLLASSEPYRPRSPPDLVSLQVREDFNTPPTIYATDSRTQKDVRVLDLNPGLVSRFQFGHVTLETVVDANGKTWSGLLYLPVNYAAGRRYPLVIQTHGHEGAKKFSVYGPGSNPLGPGSSVFAAQPLANRGIAVFQLEDKADDPAYNTSREPQLYSAAYDAVVDELATRGLIDRDRVGIAGFSRTGWHVEYALTHSHTIFAAAVVSDNLDGGYLQAATLGWPSSFSALNDAQPFGTGLKNWLENAPPFGAERIYTPLRMQVESAGLSSVLQEWELFTRLRALNLPVELFLLPDFDKSSHGLQNPRQLFNSQEGAVDWFDFWLNNHESPLAAKSNQYGRWRELRKLHEAHVGQPRPPMLEWNAVPTN